MPGQPVMSDAADEGELAGGAGTGPGSRMETGSSSASDMQAAEEAADALSGSSGMGVSASALRVAKPSPHDPLVARYPTKLPRTRAPSHRLPYGTAITVRDLFTLYLDVFGRPRRRALGQLSFFAADEDEADKLAEMASPGGSDVFFAYIEQESRSWLEVLLDFPSVHVPLPHLLELVAPLQPRSFSIASGPSALPGRLELLVAKLAYTTRFGAKRQGLCSSWLAGLPAGAPHAGAGASGGAMVAMYIVPGSFRPPVDPSAPLIMVGPGTGVAPMRSLLMEREAALGSGASHGGAAGDAGTAAAAQAANVPPFMLVQAPRDGGSASVLRSPESYAESVGPGAVGWRLFFGCRRADSDYYYARDWLRMVQGGALQGLHTAFSRSTGKHKVYVTKRLLEQAAWVGRALVEEGGYVYIAGSANRMPSDVKDVLVDCIEGHLKAADGVTSERLGSGKDRAKAMLKDLERQGRVRVEAWS